jgi:ribosome-binding factor A
VKGRRQERLAEEIREVVAQIAARELKDPRIGFLTVTRVELTADLRLARVHVGVLGGEVERERTLRALKQAVGFIRRELGRRLRLRFLPELEFRYDQGLDAAERVAQLLEEVEPEAPTSPAAPGDEEEE